MFDTCRAEEPVNTREAPIGSLMMDSVKMLFDLCLVLNNIEQVVFGKNDHISDKPEVPESLQNKVRMNCDLILTCMDKARRIHEGLM